MTLNARLIVALVLGCTGPVYAAPGDLDPSFGGTGIVTYLADPYGGGTNIGHDLTQQADGKLVVVGFPNWAVRLNTNGSIDTSFGNGGHINVTAATADAVVIQADGKIVVGGNLPNTTPDNWGISFSRYNSDGSPDTGFGSGGSVIAATDSPRNTLRALAIQPDGKIVGVGRVDVNWISKIAVFRLNVDGSLDSSFGTNGLVSTSAANTFDPNYAFSYWLGAEAKDVVVQPDGKIVVAAWSGFGTLLLRYNADGSLDSGFGGAGIVKANPVMGADLTRGIGLALQPDGRIVVGRAWQGGLYRMARFFSVARYNADGSPDTSFANNGFTTVEPVPGAIYGVEEFGFDLALQRDGKIVLAGEDNFGAGAGGFSSLVLRLNANGTMDSSFGKGGIVATHVAPGDNGDGFNAVTIQSDGKIVAAGLMVDASGRIEFSVARYDGSVNHPPVVSGVKPSIATLAPPNHQFVPITLSGATDPDGDALTYTITGVSQDEMVCVPGSGSGSTAPDAEFRDNRSDQVWLRAERDGNGDGRVYRINFRVTDSQGASTQGSTKVSVPKSANGSPAVDSGTIFNSMLKPSGC